MCLQNRVVGNVVVNAETIVKVWKDVSVDNLAMFWGLVVLLKRGAVLEDHREAVSEAFGALRKVDTQVNRLDHAWKSFLEVGDSPEGRVGVLGLLVLDLEENDVGNGHGKVMKDWFVRERRAVRTRWKKKKRVKVT